MVVLHVWMYTDANSAGPAGRPSTHVIGEMRVAVGLFFVLSGFLLARPWIAAARGERPMPDVRRFAVQRIARIGPAYWVALAGAFLLFRGTGHGREAGAAALPVFALFLENMSSATRGTLDPPMWSLGDRGRVLRRCCPSPGWAMVAAAARSGRAVGGPLLVCGGLLAVNIAWMAAGMLGGWPPETMWTLPTYLGLFACGIGTAVLVHGRRPGRALVAGLADSAAAGRSSRG